MEAEAEKLDITKVESDLQIRRNRRKLRCCLVHKLQRILKNNLLFLLTLGAVILGFALGFGLRELHPSKDALMWIGMPGELFLRMLKMMILPLIVGSVISGTASLDPKSNGKISGISFAYIVSTNALGCIIAIALALIFKPGVSSDTVIETRKTQRLDTQDIFADLLRNIVPSNIVAASFRQDQTRNIEKLSTIQRNTTNGTVAETMVTFTKVLGTSDGVNVLGLIFACTIIGIATSAVKDKGKPFLAFFTSATDIVLQVLRWFLWTTPIGILSLVTKSIAGIDDIQDIFEQLGVFVLAVSIGIAMQQLLFLPIILFLTTRRNPYKYILSISKAWMLGFASTSTAVAIPEMLQACESGNKIDQRVSRFVIPFCVTLNADGSALYITAAAIFMGNITGVSLSFSSILTIGLLTTVASMALPSIPSSSIVTLVMVLTSLNIPAHGISLLFAVEWFLDRIRTTSNVVSHTFCAAITYQYCKKDLQRLDGVQGKPSIEIEIDVLNESGQ